MKRLSLALVLFALACSDADPENADDANNLNNTNNVDICAPRLSDADCECGNFDSAWLVTGEGADCELVDSAATACFATESTCTFLCGNEFYAYDLGNGSRLIVNAPAGGLNEGWVSDGESDLTPDSCPAIVIPTM